MRVIRGTQDKFLRPHKKNIFCDTYYHSVEHLTVNQGVAGSSPAGGAKKLSFFLNESFLSKPTGLVYHHALACI